MFVCSQDSIFHFQSGSLSEVTENMSLKGWVYREGVNVGNIEYGKLVLRDEKVRSKIETCKNPDGRSIADIVLSNQPLTLTDISFSGVVPTSTSFFVCPNEKVIEYDFKRNVANDITHFVTKRGWELSRERYIGSLYQNNLIADSETDKLAMVTCKNIEGKTIADVTSKTPVLSR